MVVAVLQQQKDHNHSHDSNRTNNVTGPFSGRKKNRNERGEHTSPAAAGVRSY